MLHAENSFDIAHTSNTFSSNKFLNSDGADNKIFNEFAEFVKEKYGMTISQSNDGHGLSFEDIFELL